MKSNAYRTLVTIGLLLGAAGIPGTGHAAYPASGFVEKSVSVSFADLNLSSDAGVATLYDRLKQAAESVCGPKDLRGARSLAMRRHNRQCYGESLERAVGKVGHPELDELHGS